MWREYIAWSLDIYTMTMLLVVNQTTYIAIVKKGLLHLASRVDKSNDYNRWVIVNQKFCSHRK